jgi:hypothetical protein
MIIQSTEKYINDLQVMRITEGEFEGIEFTYGKVEIKDVDGNGVLSFDRDIHSPNSESINMEKFDKIVGDYLIGLIEEYLVANSVVYTGGIEE